MFTSKILCRHCNIVFRSFPETNRFRCMAYPPDTGGDQQMSLTDLLKVHTDGWLPPKNSGNVTAVKSLYTSSIYQLSHSASKGLLFLWVIESYFWSQLVAVIGGLVNNIQFNSIQFYLYSAITIKLSQGTLQSPGPKPPLKQAQRWQRQGKHSLLTGRNLGS